MIAEGLRLFSGVVEAARLLLAKFVGGACAGSLPVQGWERDGAQLHMAVGASNQQMLPLAWRGGDTHAAARAFDPAGFVSASRLHAYSSAKPRTSS